MSLPPPQNPVWQKLAGGALSRLRTQNLSVQLMTKRLDRTNATAAEKAAEIHAFFVKWERVLGSEIQQLAAL